ASPPGCFDHLVLGSQIERSSLDFAPPARVPRHPEPLHISAMVARKDSKLLSLWIEAEVPSRLRSTRIINDRLIRSASTDKAVSRHILINNLTVPSQNCRHNIQLRKELLGRFPHVGLIFAYHAAEKAVYPAHSLVV